MGFTIMTENPGRVWHLVREYATHAAIGGAIVTLTGFAPEEWLARVVHATHLPEDMLHLWSADIDLRTVAVVVGVAVIVGDAMWRKRSLRLAAASAAAEVAHAVAPHPVAAFARMEEHAATPTVVASDDVESPPLHINYCRTPDGVRLAYAKFGEGPALVRAGHWLSHLQLEWEDPGRRRALLQLGKGHTLVCWDARGSGLSDWDVADLSLAGWLVDMETVVAATELERFAVYGLSQTTSLAITYAARYPERVTKLILYGGYARGWKHRSPEDVEQRKAMQAMTRVGWETENPAFRVMFTAQFMPDASKLEFDAFTEIARKCVSGANAARYLDATGDIDVTDLLGRIRAPTLVGHVRGDENTPFDFGRELAAGIPGAQFVSLPGRNHVLLPGDPAREIWAQEVERFLRA
jgi:pimeloyl-ACP methyl ester carboxylesterase